MNCETIAAIYLAVFIFNLYLTHLDAKKNGFVNAVAVAASFLFIFGTFILLIVAAIDRLNNYYKKK